VQVISRYRFAASTEMKFMRAAKYSWQDYRTNNDIFPELKKINPGLKNSNLHK
jgi:hypothetical protein